MKKDSGSVFLLQLSFGLMFTLMGIYGLSDASNVMNNISSFFGGNDKVIAYVIATIELVAGALLLLSLFGVIKENITQLLLLVILVLWAIMFAMKYIFSGGLFEPNALAWLAKISPELVILAALWLLQQSKS